MRIIGRYLIKEKLGRGGMAEVYKALAPVTNRVVALKLLKPRDDIFVDLVGMEKLREIFIEEARIMGEINHEHVAKIIDCDGSAETPFFTLEYFTHSLGSNIRDSTRVKTSRVININLAYRYIRQTLLGLERLHFASIIHRDIKPHNLMITHNDRIKIIDFGLCKVLGEEKTAIPGMQVGSPYYTAPEQEQNPQKADERSDLFSVGVIAYRLITGRLVNHREKNTLPPSRLNTGLNGVWDDFLLKSIQKNRRQRYQSAYEMRLHLEEIYEKWKRKSEKNSNLAIDNEANPQADHKTLRDEPIYIKPRQLQEISNLDSLMRPQNYTNHRFECIGNSLIEDLDAGLLWQREGAGFPLNWNKACEYIDYLNRIEWRGYYRWRLPTVEELSTLLCPPTRMREFCFGSHVLCDIHWIWSCDSCTRKKAWCMDILDSYFQELDKDGMATVCAVATIKE